jgi:sterol desaturase/sphingolipid hydroxylase (fatty acid hydroxylase superfamily)
MLVVGDLIGYWVHRWFHIGPLWRVHAVHHSSTALDWLSSTRLHPVNEILSRLLSALPLLLLGFAPGLLAAYVPFLTLYALLLHANVRWDFGPLRLILASPAFHRWHHASEAAAVNRNFAGLLPLWDLLFGTVYLPSRQPAEFGVHDVRLPGSFAGLILYPFRRMPAPTAVGA